MFAADFNKFYPTIMKKYLVLVLCCGFVFASCGKKAEESKAMDSSGITQSGKDSEAKTASPKKEKLTIPLSVLDSISKLSKVSITNAFRITSKSHSVANY